MGEGGRPKKGVPMSEVAGGRWGAGISLLTLSWTPGMLTGYSDNLVRAEGGARRVAGVHKVCGEGRGQWVRIWG